MVLDPRAHRPFDPPRTQAWVDDGRLDTEWRWPRRPMSLSRRLTIGIPLAVLVVVVALVAAFGGFGPRTDRIERVPPGTELASGPLVYTFRQAVVTPPDKYGDKVWTVWVYGTVRTTGPDSETPGLSGSATTLLTAPGIDDLLDLSSYRIGTRLNSSYHSGVVTPELGAVPITLKFQAPLTWHPTGVVQVVVQTQVYRDVTLLHTGGEQGWVPINAGREVLVPAVVAT